jgi:hypothetical protein
VAAILLAAALVGCGAPKADIPPAQVTYKLAPMSTDQAKALSAAFLDQLEKMPPRMRKSFAARNARGVAAVKSLGDDKVTARYQSDITRK